MFPPTWRSTWWWTITPLTSIPRCVPGWPNGLASTYITRPHLIVVAESAGTLVSALITQRAIRRGSFRSVKDLVQKIDHFVQHSKRQQRPFIWTATANSILQKITQLCSVFSGRDTSVGQLRNRFITCAYRRPLFQLPLVTLRRTRRSNGSGLTAQIRTNSRPRMTAYSSILPPYANVCPMHENPLRRSAYLRFRVRYRQHRKHVGPKLGCM